MINVVTAVGRWNKQLGLYVTHAKRPCPVNSKRWPQTSPKRIEQESLSNLANAVEILEFVRVTVRASIGILDSSLLSILNVF